jgi:tetratricopeptide (TPR) repeat protein
MRRVLQKSIGFTMGVALASSIALAQRPKAPREPRSAKAPTSLPRQSFEELAAKANQEREAQNYVEAIPLYQKAVALRPRFDEGWWYLATLLYDDDRYEEAMRAFKQVAALRPQVGAPLAMQGLCEYRLGRYDEAAAHLQQARLRGIGENRDLERVMRFHEATLYLLRSNFETAQRIFTSLCLENVQSQELILGLGLAVLRMSAVPKQLDLGSRDRELIRRAGLSQFYFAQSNTPDAKIEYERLAADYPKTPNVHYAHGRFLSDARDDDAAIEAFRSEIEVSPSHALARLQIAYIKIRAKIPAEALPMAEEAVRLSPRLPLGYYILGRALFEVGENARAIETLEQARAMAPAEARIYYTLARAYGKANRRDDAERARETFDRLNVMAEEAARRGEKAEGAIEDRESEKLKP